MAAHWGSHAGLMLLQSFLVLSRCDYLHFCTDSQGLRDGLCEALGQKVTQKVVNRSFRCPWKKLCLIPVAVVFFTTRCGTV